MSDRKDKNTETISAQLQCCAMVDVTGIRCDRNFSHLTGSLMSRIRSNLQKTSYIVNDLYLVVKCNDPTKVLPKNKS